MSVTIDKVDTKEREWDKFLASLKPWELHALTKDATELVAHDLFCEGELSLREIRQQINLDMEDVRP